MELDITSPGVDSVFPEAGSLDVPVEAIFTIDFDEGMDDTTLSGMNILVQDADGVPVIGEPAYDLETGKTTFTPATNLQHFTTYSVLLRGDITDRAGNGLNGGSGYIWTFTTVGLAPEGPVGLTATTDNTSITLAWHPPVSMGSGEFQGYNVYRLMDEGLPNQEFEFWAYVIGTGFVDNDVAEGVQYHYIVRGVSSYAEGVDSDVASAVVLPSQEDPEDPEDPIGPGPNDIKDMVDVSPKNPVGSLTLTAIAVIAFAILVSVYVVRRRTD